MTNLLKFALLSTTLIFSSVGAQSKPDPYARDLVQMSKWFEGHFDNDSQLWFEADRRWQGKEKDKHRRNHAMHMRIDKPKIGEYVFYVEEYMDDDRDNIWRQRIVSLHSTPPKGIQMKLFFCQEW